MQAREIEEGEEALDATSLTWHRLLATSQALYRGASFEDMRMPAYGGSLFDPARFPFLTATTEHGTLAVTVSDRVMLHVLRSVQHGRAQGGEARRISFRDIDVEQIGYIYEGLLGYTARHRRRDLPRPDRHVRRGARDPARRRWSSSPRQHATRRSSPTRSIAWVERGPAVGQAAVGRPRIAKAIGAEAEPNADQRV